MKKSIFALFLLNFLLFAYSEEFLEFSSALQIDSNLSNIDYSNFNSYENAVKVAKEKDKKILLEVIINNCKFCKEMEEKVISKDHIQEAIDKNFVFVQVNADKTSLPLNLDEQMSPMFVFVSKNETIIDIRFGYIEENEFLRLLEEQSKK